MLFSAYSQLFLPGFVRVYYFFLGVSMDGKVVSFKNKIYCNELVFN